MSSTNMPESQQLEKDKGRLQNEGDIKYFGKLNNFDFSFTKDCEEKLDVIPMDVDKSLEKKVDTDESSVEVLDGENKLRKRRRVKKEDQDQGNPRKILKGSDDLDGDGPSKHRLAMFLLKIFILLVCLYMAFVHNPDLNLQDNFKVLSHNIFKQRDKCDNPLDFNKVFGQLKQNIYGQDEMIEILSKSMYTKNFKTLVFTGPTGVGKTYTIEILEQFFPWSRNVFNIHYPMSKSDLQVLKLTLSHCGYNLVVLDGLDLETPKGLYETMRDLQQFCYQKKIKTFVVLVYNTQELSKKLKPVDHDFGQNILDGFKQEFKDALDVSLVPFARLTTDNVISCVMAEAAKLHLKITKEEAIMIAEDIPDIYGCKGAQAKLMILKPDGEL